MACTEYHSQCINLFDRVESGQIECSVLDLLKLLAERGDDAEEFKVDASLARYVERLIESTFVMCVAEVIKVGSLPHTRT